ncbi:MAG: hypothetical protein DI591_11145 [Citromicrobium sp.]|nr:MAG: hypothetical protein DI591_11145 [Citromicrobium sp.]
MVQLRGAEHNNMQMLLLPFRKYSDFSGRASRQEFWFFLGLSAGIFLAAVVLTGVSAGTSAEASPTWALLYVFWWVVSAVPWFALIVRRLHDQGRSGILAWGVIAGYVMLFVMPTVGALLLLASLGLMSLPGDEGGNRFGEPPPDGFLVAEIGADTVPPSEDGQTPRAQKADEYGVTRMADGRFGSHGHSFGTYREAHRFAAAQRRRSTARVTAEKSPRAPARHAAKAFPSSASRPLAALPEKTRPVDPYEVKSTSDGRFRSGGYTFTTQAQAESFAARRGASPRAVGSIAGTSVKQRSGSARMIATDPSLSAMRSDARNDARRIDSLDRFARSLRPGARSSDTLGSAIVRGKSGSGSRPRFIAEPTKIELAGIHFEAELLYFGTGGGPGNPRHRALVDPLLPVASYSDAAGGTLDYWPHYGELAPSARRAFLEWLAGGRERKDVPIGYVFIYFYGLERRLIAEKSEVDAPSILAEARRLLRIYGDNHSFRNYCSALIEAGELIFDLADEDEPLTLYLRRSWEIPFSVRLRLGRKVRDGQPIDADDALRWAITHPQIYPRTAVTRCFEEFCALWRIRFDETFPDGIKVRPGKTRLQFHYRAASSEFNANASVEDVPDVGAIAGPIGNLDALFASCTDELDPLSRFLGRNGGDRSSLLAAALCPAPALTPAAASAVAKARMGLLGRQDSAGLALVTVEKALDLLAGTNAAGPEHRATVLKRLPSMFDALGLGFEPDKRHGPVPALGADTVLCLFELDGASRPIQDCDEYRAARTMVEIAVLAAKADDVVVEIEIEAILGDLARYTALNAADRRRLHAHASALVANPSKLRVATKRLLELPDDEKDAVLATAVRAVLADGRVLPTEVRFLEGLYKSLGKPQDDVYTRLHSAESVPRSRDGAPVGRKGGLDAERLARLREETTVVSSMLSAIFREDDGPVISPTNAGVDAGPKLPGLDQAHTHVLLALAEQPIELDAFEELCRMQRLLPDGAIETINDWSFDSLDDLAIESEDIVSLQPHLISRIRSMATA